MRKLTHNRLKELYALKNAIMNAVDESTQKKTGLSLLDFEVWMNERKNDIEIAVQGLNKLNCQNLFFKVFLMTKELHNQETTNSILLEQQQELTKLAKTFSVEVKKVRTKKNTTLGELTTTLSDLQLNLNEINKIMNLDKSDLLNILTIQSNFIQTDLELSQLELDKVNDEEIQIYKSNIETLRKFYKICYSYLHAVQQSLYSRMVDLKKIESLPLTGAGRAVKTVIESKEREALKHFGITSQHDLMANVENLLIFSKKG